MLLGAVVGVVLGMLIGHFTALSEAPVEHVAVRARNPGGSDCSPGGRLFAAASH